MSKKTFRSIDFNDERKWKSTCLLDDVLQVGSKKALGYVTAPPIENLSELADRFRTSGKMVYLKEKISSCGDKISYLWVGDEILIQDVLNENLAILIKNKWPLSGKEVFDLVCRTDVDHFENIEMYHFICDLFNSWCLWCERTCFDENQKMFLSKDPYDPDDSE